MMKGTDTCLKTGS